MVPLRAVELKIQLQGQAFSSDSIYLFNLKKTHEMLNIWLLMWFLKEVIHLYLYENIQYKGQLSKNDYIMKPDLKGKFWVQVQDSSPVKW